MIRKRAISTSGLLLLATGFAQAQQTSWQVTITELQLPPGGFGASALGINDTGKIVGIATDPTGTHTVEWVNGQIANFPPFLGGAGGLAHPEDLNDAGESVGYEHVFSSIVYALHWDAQNNPSALPGIPGGSVSSNHAHGINSAGQIVGYSREGAPNFWMHAVVWYQGSVQSDLGFLGGGHQMEAFGINDLGAVVGTGTLPSFAPHAFLWENGQLTDLSTWTGGGVVSKAFAINNHGDIVGMNANVAALWHNGSVQALPMPPGLSAYTSVIDINDAGDMIATSGPPFEVGVLWRNGTPISLGTLPGGTISRAYRINAAGEIVGESNAADGFFHAVKWTVTAVATPYCSGDGSAGPCPCANMGASGHGCQNSATTGGAMLSVTGTPSLSADSLLLTSAGELPSVTSVFLQGTSTVAPAVFGDGLRCVGGSLKRLFVHNAIAGSVSAPQSGDPHVSVRSAALGDPLTAGSTRYYQTYYRDPVLGFCPAPTGNSWNVSSGLEVHWGQ